jgi:hypothetical protein
MQFEVVFCRYTLTHPFFISSLSQMPYLIRRANENSSIASAANEELKMISSELRSRVTGKKRASA